MSVHVHVHLGRKRTRDAAFEGEVLTQTAAGDIKLLEGKGKDAGYFAVRVAGKGDKHFNRRSDARDFFEYVKKNGPGSYA